MRGGMPDASQILEQHTLVLVYSAEDASRSSQTTRVTVSHRHGSASRTRNDCEYMPPHPSLGSFSFRLCSVGDSAKNAFHSNPENTVFDAKRLIGRKFDDPEIQRDQKHWPFKVVNKGGKPNVQVKYRGELREFVSIFPFVAPHFH